MAKYTITWCEVKKTGERNGKPWTINTMTLKDEQGVITENVDTFDTIVNGSTIEGEIIPGKYGKDFVKAKAVAGANLKTAQIEKTMERKEQSIGKFQDNKELSIKVSSTMRDAVLLAIAEGQPNIETILKWREWLWKNFEVPTDLYPPFN